MIGKKTKVIIVVAAVMAAIAVIAYIIYYFYMKSKATINAQAYTGKVETQSDKNLQAFLMLIRNGESKLTPDAYCITMGGTASKPIYFTDPAAPDFSRHPRIRNKQFNSDAAGAYQIISTTWDWLNKSLNLPDFSPASQDKAAIWLITYRGAYEAVLRGDLNTALAKCAKEWASLPTSKYGQPTVPLAAATNIYTSNGGLIA
jgi:lysozyme